MAQILESSVIPHFCPIHSSEPIRYGYQNKEKNQENMGHEQISKGPEEPVHIFTIYVNDSLLSDNITHGSAHSASFTHPQPLDNHNYSKNQAKRDEPSHNWQSNTHTINQDKNNWEPQKAIKEIMNSPISPSTQPLSVPSSLPSTFFNHSSPTSLSSTYTSMTQSMSQSRPASSPQTMPVAPRPRYPVTGVVPEQPHIFQTVHPNQNMVPPIHWSSVLMTPATTYRPVMLTYPPPIPCVNGASIEINTPNPLEESNPHVIYSIYLQNVNMYVTSPATEQPRLGNALVHFYPHIPLTSEYHSRPPSPFNSPDTKEESTMSSTGDMEFKNNQDEKKHYPIREDSDTDYMSDESEYECDGIDNNSGSNLKIRLSLQ